MGDFAAAWLALREPADHAARSVRLTNAIAGVLPRDAPVHVLDLGAGTGSNMRYLTGRLQRGVAAEPGVCRQDWLLVDHDPALLAQVSMQMRHDRPTCRVETRHVKLAALDDDGSRAIFDGRDLVTASALLDLVSEEWLRSLAARCREQSAAVLFALSYDGRVHCSPEDPEDSSILDLVNQHQRTDKGFGPALGPAATDAAERCFASLGYQVQRDPSDWMLPPESRDLQRQLIEGWAAAALAISPDRSSSIRDWLARRLAHVAGNRSRLIVGHQDLAAWLPNAVCTTRRARLQPSERRSPKRLALHGRATRSR
jgi:hypothetical protein